MNIEKLVLKVNAPADVRVKAMHVLAEAKEKAKGLNWQKAKSRWFKSKKLAKKLTWGSERLIDIDPALIEHDIAPTRSVTAYGDHFDWDDATKQPQPGTWLNDDTTSAEYQRAVEMTKKRYINAHPRSDKFHKWWYRRNAGEGVAWMRGSAVDMPNRPVVYRGDNVLLIRSGDAFELIAFKKWFGKFGLVTRVGYEIDNVWNYARDTQGHYPLDGWELRAPLTWTNLPGKRPELLL